MWDGMAGVECVEEGDEESDYEHRGYDPVFRVETIGNLTNSSKIAKINITKKH